MFCCAITAHKERWRNKLKLKSQATVTSGFQRVDVHCLRLSSDSLFSLLPLLSLAPYSQSTHVTHRAPCCVAYFLVTIVFSHWGSFIPPPILHVWVINLQQQIRDKCYLTCTKNKCFVVLLRSLVLKCSEITVNSEPPPHPSPVVENNEPVLQN